MKLRNKIAILATLMFSFAGLSLGLVSKNTTKVSADSTQIAIGTASSGKIFFVNGSGTYFKKGEADLAIYCYRSDNTSINAWSDRYDYRITGDTIRVMIPYRNGQSTTFSHYIICRYDPTKNPQTDGWGGVFNQSADLSFSEYTYYANTITVNGIGSDNKLTVASIKSSNLYYGIKRSTNNYMYLDLSNFPQWEEGGAKFAIYFACPNVTDEKRWSSFCWKVQGQDNPHLYECYVPEYASGADNLWNLVIAVRFDPNLAIPCWPEDKSLKWNQSNDLTFISTNHTANMIRVTGWDAAELDAPNSISMETRVEFYGRYFMDTVSCSGSGATDVTTSDQWNAVKDEYNNHLSTKYQGEVWKAKADASTSASLVAQAMARYDYIVFYKRYNHEDFINRATSENLTQYSYIGATIHNDFGDSNLAIIAIVASISLLSLTTLIILKKKHK